MFNFNYALESKRKSRQKVLKIIKELNISILGELRVVLLMLFILFSITQALGYGEVSPYNENWYIRSDKSEWANRDRKTFSPPAVGSHAKRLNKAQRILYRSNKRHAIPYNSYNSHISDREYTDCSYYKYVDCSNYTFCRCWQCRDYVYPIRRDYVN